MPQASLSMHTLLTLAAETFILVSWWKPLILAIVFVPWAWVVSTIYDKHAAQFFLPRRQWNIGHMIAGLTAVVLAIFVGMLVGKSEGAFWAGLGVMIVVLVADLAAYMVVANKDDRVPEKFKIRLNMARLNENAKVVKAAKAAAKVQAKVALNIRTADEKGKYTKTFAAPMAETPEFETRTAAEAMFIAASRARASQFEIGPIGKDNLYGVSWMVDGMKQSGETMPAANAARIMDFWKSAAALDVTDRRRKQVGMLQVEDGLSKTVCRVTSIGAQGGMKVSMLFNPEQAVIRKIDDAGLLELQVKELKEIAAEAKGVVLITSPPDGGRTTMLYAMLRLHDAYISNVQTVELEPQATIEGVRSNKFDPQASGPSSGDGAPPSNVAPGAPATTPGGEFSTLVRSILRRDPDVVGVAELPDPQTAKEIARADHERTRIYLSFKANDAMTAVQTYVKAVGDARQAAESLHGVINQRLLRRLCTNCRVGYPPSADMLKKLGVPGGRVQQLFKKGGQVLIKNKPESCPTCGGGGYYGQDGIFEVYSLNKEDRDFIATGNYQGLKAALRKKNLPTLQQVAICKAADGITSVEEVMRVTTTEGPATPPPPISTAGTNGSAAPSASPPTKPSAT